MNAPPLVRVAVLQIRRKRRLRYIQYSDQPVDQHHGNAKHQRLKARTEDAKDLVAKIDMQVADDEVFP